MVTRSRRTLFRSLPTPSVARSSGFRGRSAWPTRRRRGFALVVALALMAFLVLLVVSLATIGRVDAEIIRSQRALAQAQANALFALDLALGQLQEAAGPDQRVTARAEIEGGIPDGARFWTGVWDFTSGNPTPSPTWLVSGENPISLVNGTSYQNHATDSSGVWIVGPGTLPGGTSADYVYAPFLNLFTEDPVTGNRDLETGKCAFWIGDEGVKTALNGVESLEYDSVAEEWRFPAQNVRERFSRGAEVTAQLPGLDPESEELERLSRIFDAKLGPESLNALERSIFHASFHNFASVSFGLLTDSSPVTGGGLRHNLAAPTTDTTGGPLDYFLNGRVVEVWNSYPIPASDGSVAMSFTGARNYDDLIPGEPFVQVSPILVEAQLRMAVFAYNSSGDPAIRFHIRAEFWNPFNRPMRLGDGGKIPFTVALSGMPEMVVENSTTGAGTDYFELDDLPGFGNATPGFSAYMVMDGDDGTSGNDPPILQPGEVFRLTDPNPDPPVRQKRGLIRYINKTLVVQSQQKVFVAVGTPSSGITFSLHEGENRYGSTIWELKNVPYFSSSTEMTAGSYFAVTSGEIDVSRDFDLAYHYALGTSRNWAGSKVDSQLAGDWLYGFDLRAASIDYEGRFIDAGGVATDNEDFVRVSSFDPFDGEDNLDVFDGAEWLYDDSERVFGVEDSSEYRLFDLPVGVPASLGDFRHLPFKNLPPFALGTAASESNQDLMRSLNSVFDKIVLIPDSEVSIDQLDAVSFHRLSNGIYELHLADRDRAVFLSDDQARAIDLTEKEAAKYLWIRGAFNWHSTSVQAWEARLTQSFSNSRKWTVGQDEVDIAHSIFRHNLSAQLGPVPLSDEEIANEPEFSDPTLRKAFAGQGIRVLTESEIHALASAIVEELKVREIPFPSFEAFIDDGLFDRAIEVANLNESFPPFANGYLRQSDLVAMLAPTGAIRSDTFRIRTYGDTRNSFSDTVQGRVGLEVVVQRVLDYDPLNPNELEPSHRKFKILLFRWLNPYLDF